MTGVYRILAAGALAACLMVAGRTAEPARTTRHRQPDGKAGGSGCTGQGSRAAARGEARRRNSAPRWSRLRDRVRNTLAPQQKQAFNTRENSATEIMNFCLAFGCGTEVLLDGQSGKQINGITGLCWNYPCAGFEMLGPSQGHIAPRIGYGYQEHPGEFLAMLAMSRVQADYPVRFGKTIRTVADLVEAEKLGCRSGSDASLKLVGLAYYVDEPQWKNDLGETWSLDRMVEEELAQPVVSAPEGGLNRLLGLSYAVARRAKHGQPLDGQLPPGREVRGRLPGVRPESAERRRQLGAVLPGRPEHEPGRRLAVAIDRPRAGVVGHVVARQASSKTPAWSTPSTM